MQALQDRCVDEYSAYRMQASSIQGMDWSLQLPIQFEEDFLLQGQFIMQAEQ
jgi:hypothetical protein